MKRGLKATGKSILVVDDDPVIGLLVGERLEPDGYRVTVARDGSGGLELAQRQPPDLVLLDVNLPDLDGFEVCRRIRSAPWGQHLPVMMLTAMDDVASVERSFREGASDFFTKPVNWPLLAHRVSFLLRAADSLEALRRSEERYALAARGANDGLWDWDLSSGKVYYSPRWLEMLGLDQGGVAPESASWLERIPNDDREQVQHALRAHFDGQVSHFECEYRIRCGDGSLRWMLGRGLAVFDENATPVRMAGSQTDVTERKLAELKLAHDALHDALTGLPNRILFMDRLQHALDRAQREKKFGFALLFLDLDRFKWVNDSLGHLQGDRLLGKVAEHLRSAMRTNDTLARFGGDEFTVLCDGCISPTAIFQSVTRLLDAVSQPLALGGDTLIVNASIGLALSTSGYTRAEDMLRDADTAMYRAKEKGRGRYEIFDDGMRRRVVDLLQIESDLNGAAERGELRLYYQPIVEAGTGGLLGFEALLRWQHPQRGLLRPTDFLNVAEETGQILAIGRWVIREAARQLVQWRRSPMSANTWYVSVNLSASEVKDAELPALVERVLKEQGLKPADLRLELTESVLLHDGSIATENLRRLHELGIKLCIDDFGTGYSSFSYLHRHPFDVLKIDSSFMHSLSHSHGRREILRAIVAMAHNLGMTVVAEGVENRHDAVQLPALHCDSVQGHLFSEPFAAEGLEDYLSRSTGSEARATTCA